MRNRWIVHLSTLVLAMSVGTVAMAQTSVTGAGASFPAPLYSKWADSYHKATGHKVNYQSIGSSGGIKQIIAGTVNFGASDMPLQEEALAKDNLFQFPTVIGGVVPVINVQGIKPGELNVTGDVLANIFAGKIKKWNDPVISKLNPNLTLPDQDILVVRRADGSGTTFIFTHYLSQVSEDWKNAIGEGTTVNWPTGTGGKGNDGVSALVQRLKGAIGYVEYAYAKQNNMTYLTLQNAAGNIVHPNEESFKAAAAQADWKSSYYQLLTNQADPKAWPIAGATFILLSKAADKADSNTSSIAFFDWAFTEGNQIAESLDYVTLPEEVQAHIRADWQKTLSQP